ncbi:putative antirepressor protein [Fusobacterium phage vB_FnuS_FNU3]|uniref:Antirepressor n=1 Tax=Fusobacterium phage Fnu1 TaxID=2530024 RepID=A0A481W5J9_9CAUD|nr:antirepressor [Fusobacterium phage Fnu1]QBJ04147.1 antirepressor [Fusobacterium phage Fnu1]WGH50266.1 putative antirepressor [Fusobacterium phage vB_FnuS_FNU2]WGH50408.1 putative antirepressor protein [Fusobacterium phage vB_FnuS_FNU3]
MNEKTLKGIIESICVRLEINSKICEELKADNLIIIQQLKELFPNKYYYGIILENENPISEEQLAKDYNFEVATFKDLLSNLGIVNKTKNYYILAEKYQGCNYIKSELKDNEIISYWTQKGRLFIYDFLKQKGILPTIEKENIDKE